MRGSLLITVTEFFRDTDLFDAIRTNYLPQLLERAGERRELRVWSAGCATGEEAYSLAMLVSDALGSDVARWSVRIFATDADPEAIAFARRGIDPGSALKGVDEVTLARHFRDLDGAYEVAPHIRAMTVFGEHDLAQRAPFPRIDLVLCRNVLIYFTPELQRRALQLFACSLRYGGFLALGKSETGHPEPTAFVIEANAPAAASGVASDERAARSSLSRASQALEASCRCCARHSRSRRGAARFASSCWPSLRSTPSPGVSRPGRRRLPTAEW